MQKLASCFLTLLLTVGTLLPSAAFGVTATPTLDRLKKAGKLVVAIDATYPPMESEDAKGQPVGFDIDFARELAKRLGLKAEFQVMGWDGILAGLNSKRFDVIISTMNITPERQKQVAFVEYAKLSQLFIARKGTKVTSDKDLAGKVVAVQADTTSYDYVESRRKAGVKISDVKAFRLATDAFTALQANQADVLVVDEPVGKYYAKQNPSLFVITGRAMAPEPIGVAMRKDEADLTKSVQQAVDAMKKDGSVKKMQVTWFGSVLGV